MQLNMDDLIELADDWAALGWDIQGQARDFFEDPTDEVLSECNPNALLRIAEFLQACADRGIAGAPSTRETLVRFLEAAKIKVD